jgi:hypothetical protein
MLLPPLNHTTSLLLLLLLPLLQIGLSQQRLMAVFHLDALYLLQMTSDLQYVCSKLADPNTREPRMVSGVGIKSLGLPLVETCSTGLCFI